MKISIITDDKLNLVDEYLEMGIEAFEITLNEDASYFIQNFDEIKQTIESKKLTIASLGQWGSEKIVDGAINLEQFEIDKQLIACCAKLGSEKFVTGINHDETLTIEQNNQLAIKYLNDLSQFAQEMNVDICIYNCDWNNYVYNEEMWSQIIDACPAVKLKYDPSHSYYRDQNYLAELRDRIADVGHFHVKGGMKIDNQRYDDPPAFMDQIDWNSIFSILNIENYQGYVSIEPHSLNIDKTKMLNGVRFTFNKLNEIIL